MYFTYASKGEVNGDNFWNMHPIPPQIKHIEVLEMESEKNEGELTTLIHWINSDNQPILEEKREMEFEVEENNYMIDFTIELKALNEAVTFEDTKEGMFAIRVADWMCEKNKGTPTGVPTGFKQLDSLTSGFQNSDLIILAARPSMGKTAFALNVARNAAVDGNIPVAFFSLEMSSIQLVNRLIAAETELGAEKIKTGKLEDYEWTQLNQRIKTLDDAAIFIDDTPALSIFEFRAKCRRLKMQHDIIGDG